MKIAEIIQEMEGIVANTYADRLKLAHRVVELAEEGIDMRAWYARRPNTHEADLIVASARQEMLGINSHWSRVSVVQAASKHLANVYQGEWVQAMDRLRADLDAAEHFDHRLIRVEYCDRSVVTLHRSQAALQRWLNDPTGLPQIHKWVLKSQSIVPATYIKNKLIGWSDGVIEA